MTERIQRTKTVTKKAQPEPEVQVPSQSSKTTEELKAEMDEILDEIDGVLEENAEEFVANYRQKGGE